MTKKKRKINARMGMMLRPIISNAGSFVGIFILKSISRRKCYGVFDCCFSSFMTYHKRGGYMLQNGIGIGSPFYNLCRI